MTSNKWVNLGKLSIENFKKLIEAADAFIEVLDARDPMRFRSEDIEQEALKLNKKLILILNKINHVPPKNSRMWQSHLRSEFPCILFKANV
jgi:nuclear GTP-binding protein